MEDRIRVFNRTEEKAKRQQLRRDAPLAERKLWFHLRGGRLDAPPLLRAVTQRLQPDYPALTPRLLDNRLWQYQRGQ